MKAFVQEIGALAEELEVFLAIHPDDPPIKLLGLPRIVSTSKDLELLTGHKNSTLSESDINFIISLILGYYPSVHNGVTMCVGSFASRPDNDITDMVSKFADKINFVHLRNVK